MEQMLIIAGGVALGGFAVIYRKAIVVGLLALTGLAVLFLLGLWAANSFTEPVIQHLIRLGWADANAYKGGIWWMITLLITASLISCALQVIADIRNVPVLDLVAPIARMRRVSKARSVAKAADVYLAQLAGHPLENCDHAQSYLAVVEKYLVTLRPVDVDYAIYAAIAARGKAVVAACERAQRIERIAELQDRIASCENITAIVASGNIPDWWSKDFAARMTDPAERARSAKYVEEMKADLVAAKTGALTWYIPDDDHWYKDADGKVHRLGPRGLGLTVAKVAAAEAYLDGFARVEAEPVDGGRWSTAFAQRMAIAANRGLAA